MRNRSPQLATCHWATGRVHPGLDPTGTAPVESHSDPVDGETLPDHISLGRPAGHVDRAVLMSPRRGTTTIRTQPISGSGAGPYIELEREPGAVLARE